MAWIRPVMIALSELMGDVRDARSIEISCIRTVSLRDVGTRGRLGALAQGARGRLVALQGARRGLSALDGRGGLATRHRRRDCWGTC